MTNLPVTEHAIRRGVVPSSSPRGLHLSEISLSFSHSSSHIFTLDSIPDQHLLDNHLLSLRPCSAWIWLRGSPGCSGRGYMAVI